MNALGHVLIGFASAIVITSLLGLKLEFGLGVVAVVFLGALAPDVDHRKSRLFKLVLGAACACSGVLAFELARGSLELLPSILVAVGAACVAGALVLLVKPRHRGFTHSFSALALFSLAVYALTQSPAYAIAGGSAYASHLVADNTFKPF